MIYTDENYMLQTIKPRDRSAHKGDFGKLLLFAGSAGMAGAAVLCGRAALRTGSGLVQFLLPSIPCEIYPVLQTAVPEATCVAFSEDMDLLQYDAIACGSGIGQNETSLRMLRFLLERFGQAENKTLLLDADALNLLSRNEDLARLAKEAKAALIITPHIGEAKRLLSTCAGIRSFTDRKNAVCDLADKYGCIAILKGTGTLVAARSSGSAPFMIYENTTGNPGMATAGSGDVLSGIIISLAGQGYAPVDAARAGVFVHGKAGDLAAEEFGEMSVTAGDIANYIPYALKPFYKQST